MYNATGEKFKFWSNADSYKTIYIQLHRSYISQCLDIQVFSGNKICFRQSYLYIINLIQYHF